MKALIATIGVGLGVYSELHAPFTAIMIALIAGLQVVQEQKRGGQPMKR